MWWRRILEFSGGGISRAAGTGLAVAMSMIVFGMSPAELVMYLWNAPPAWLLNGWTRLLVLIVGLAVFFVSFRFNVWDQRQNAIDSLAEDISQAIHELVNRHTREDISTPEQVKRFADDYHAWCDRVHKKLENRAFFTRADQLHVERLGFIDPVKMTGQSQYDWFLSQLKLKFERLREIINLIQSRRR